MMRSFRLPFSAFVFPLVFQGFTPADDPLLDRAVAEYESIESFKRGYALRADFASYGYRE